MGALGGAHVSVNVTENLLTRNGYVLIMEVDHNENLEFFIDELACEGLFCLCHDVTGQQYAYE